MKVTRKDLEWFSEFVKINGLEEKFVGCQLYSNSIYLGDDSHNYLNWNSEADYEVLLKVIKAINCMFDLELELI